MTRDEIENSSTSGFGLAQVKQEGRYYTFDPVEDLNNLSHVIVKLRNQALDKRDKKLKDQAE